MLSGRPPGFGGRRDVARNCECKASKAPVVAPSQFASIMSAVASVVTIGAGLVPAVATYYKVEQQGADMKRMEGDMKQMEGDLKVVKKTIRKVASKLRVDMDSEG